MGWMVWQGMSVTPASGTPIAGPDDDPLHFRQCVLESRRMVANMTGASPFASPLVQPSHLTPQVPPFGLN